MKTFFTLALLAFGAVYIWYRARSNRGLDQWPTPHGRFYDEWLAIKGDHEDYYEWLAKKMHHAEPWKTWAEMERNLPRKS